ncbi:hypothetical protein EH240_13950 [Mesorhizobium tamadayense]|uniref:Uncharacterized protein n=1 Tax=Mesorhizobium tamadayense TaxID=425306 RepID=A0A3P3FT00_9HYPH|nr:hypothetical protein [Mesorhizobium tamadayense]RRI01746.1 hypothetical protein EH240_13950 [Mesorhizobium tamadayense]
MTDMENLTLFSTPASHTPSSADQGFPHGARWPALTAAPAGGRGGMVFKRFTTASPIVFTTLAVLISPVIAQALDPLEAPQGSYVASTHICADLDQGVGALELAEFDGDAITVGASTCKIAGTRHGDAFQASCTEPGSNSPVITPMKITRPSSDALSINGTLYNFCPGK